MNSLTLPVVIEADSDGYFVYCPALQGCYSQGDSYEEAIANIKDAIKLNLVDRVADGEGNPGPGERESFYSGSFGVTPRLPRLTAREIIGVLENLASRWPDRAAAI